MEQYLILARSITYAQRMDRVLRRVGVRSEISRAPRTLTELGCAYILRLETEHIDKILGLLHREGLEPVRVFRQEKGYREVKPG